MKKQLLGFCGYDCATCPAYIATKANDHKMKEEVAKKMSQFMGLPLTADDVNCTGCVHATYNETAIMEHCKNCIVRLSAKERGLTTTCADCPEYACSKLKTTWEQIPPGAKENLEMTKKNR